jgi:hypothetical protein
MASFKKAGGSKLIGDGAAVPREPDLTDILSPGERIFVGRSICNPMTVGSIPSRVIRSKA